MHVAHEGRAARRPVLGEEAARLVADSTSVAKSFCTLGPRPPLRGLVHAAVAALPLSSTATSTTHAVTISQQQQHWLGFPPSLLWFWRWLLPRKEKGLAFATARRRRRIPRKNRLGNFVKQLVAENELLLLSLLFGWWGWGGGGGARGGGGGRGSGGGTGCRWGVNEEKWGPTSPRGRRGTRRRPWERPGTLAPFGLYRNHDNREHSRLRRRKRKRFIRFWGRICWELGERVVHDSRNPFQLCSILRLQNNNNNNKNTIKTKI